MPKEKDVTLEDDLRKAGAIVLSRDQEIADIERQIEDHEKENRDPRQVAQELEEKKFKLAVLKLREDLQNMSREPAFRRISWKLLEISGLFKVSFVKGDSHETALREGRRSVGLDFLALIQSVDPAIFLQMQREHVSDQKSNERRNT